MKLRIVGLGIQEISQLTLCGLSHLRAARRVLVLPVVDEGVLNALSDLGLGSCESLKSLYQSGTGDEENYRRIYDFVLKACRDDQDVALLIPGHPRIGVTLVQWFEANQEALGLQLTVVEGISSFCSMINDLARDPIEKGSVLLDANRLLLFGYSLEPALDHYIYHVCSIGTAQVNVHDPAKENKIETLKKYLLQYYPPEHKLELVSSSNREGGPAERYSCVLGELENILGKVHFGTTLFIPGLRPKKIDRVYLNLLSSSGARSC